MRDFLQTFSDISDLQSHRSRTFPSLCNTLNSLFPASRKLFTSFVGFRDGWFHRLFLDNFDFETCWIIY